MAGSTADTRHDVSMLILPRYNRDQWMRDRLAESRVEFRDAGPMFVSWSVWMATGIVAQYREAIEECTPDESTKESELLNSYREWIDYLLTERSNGVLSGAERSAVKLYITPSEENMPLITQNNAESSIASREFLTGAVYYWLNDETMMDNRDLLALVKQTTVEGLNVAARELVASQASITRGLMLAHDSDVATSFLRSWPVLKEFSSVQVDVPTGERLRVPSKLRPYAAMFKSLFGEQGWDSMRSDPGLLKDVAREIELHPVIGKTVLDYTITGGKMPVELIVSVIRDIVGTNTHASIATSQLAAVEWNNGGLIMTMRPKYERYSDRLIKEAVYINPVQTV